MIPLVKLPKIVEHYTAYYTGVFSPEALIEFQRYVSGLLVSANKTVEGINRRCVFENRNQSSLKRLLTASPLDVDDGECRSNAHEAARQNINNGWPPDSAASFNPFAFTTKEQPNPTIVIAQHTVLTTLAKSVW